MWCCFRLLVLIITYKHKTCFMSSEMGEASVTTRDSLLILENLSPPQSPHQQEMFVPVSFKCMQYVSKLQQIRVG